MVVERANDEFAGRLQGPSGSTQAPASARGGGNLRRSAPKHCSAAAVGRVHESKGGIMNDRTAQRAMPPVTLIGHPNLTIGRSEHIRTVWRAFRASGVGASIYNLQGLPAPPEPAFQELVPHTITKLP